MDIFESRLKILELESKLQDYRDRDVWHDMDSAPKGSTREEPCKEKWILGIDSSGEQRVIRWTVEYPCSEGVWMFAYTPTDYISEIQTFLPVKWRELPDGEG